MIPSLIGLGVIALGLILLRYALTGSFWSLPAIGVNPYSASGPEINGAAGPAIG